MPAFTPPKNLRGGVIDWIAGRFELSRGGGELNVRPMEGLRGFAVALVFIVHYVALVQPWIGRSEELRAFASAFHTIGNTGVDLFFVLSGYLIYGSLIERPQQFVKFMRRRIQRIYPAFCVVFCMYVGLSHLVPAESKIPSEPFAAAVYLLENFLLLPGLFPTQPMITVAWSLSYEMFYYLVIPIIISLAGLRDRTRAWRMKFFLVLAIVVTAYFAFMGGPIRLVMFIAGILLHEVVVTGRLESIGNLGGLLALSAGLLATVVPLSGPAGALLSNVSLFVGFFVLCLACFRCPGEWLGQAFSWTPLRWLGNMSYSYYLLHGLTLKVAFVAITGVLPTGQGAWVFWVLLPPMFVITLIPTAALFLLVERPYSLAQKMDGRAKSALASRLPA